MGKPLLPVDGDDLEAFIATQSDEVKDAVEDAEEFYRLVRTLAGVRRTSGAKQKHVASEMGTTQSAVSALENLRNDPQISTLMRYARAVGCRVRLTASVEGLARAEVAAGAWRPSKVAVPVKVSKASRAADMAGARGWSRSA